MFGFYNYYTEYEKLKTKFISSSENGNKKCSRCTLCCWRRPGTLSKTDVPKIATFLKVTKKELFKKYLAVDDINGLCLVPIRKNQTYISGNYISAEESYNIGAPCTFLNEDSKECTLHDVKPFSCRELHCWEESKDSGVVVWEESDLKKLGWDGLTDEYCDINEE